MWSNTEWNSQGFLMVELKKQSVPSRQNTKFVIIKFSLLLYAVKNQKKCMKKINIHTH